MKKKLLRWVMGISLAMVLGFLGLLLSFNTIAKWVVEKRLRAATGMETSIGQFDLGWRTSTVHFQNLIVKNPPEFGGGVFLHLPELYLEYDRDALRAGKLALKLVRLDIAEVSIVENKAGKKNIDGMVKPSSKSKTRDPIGALATGEKDKPPFVFAGIDVMEVSLDSVKFTSEKNPEHNLDLHFGSEHELFRNLQTELDFQTAGLVLFLKAGLSGSLDLESLLQPRAKKRKKSRMTIETLTNSVSLNATNL